MLRRDRLEDNLEDWTKSEPVLAIKSLLGFHKNRQLDAKVSVKVFGWRRIRMSRNGMLIGKPPGKPERQVLPFSDREILVGDLIESIQRWDKRLSLLVSLNTETDIFTAEWRHKEGKIRVSITTFSHSDKLCAVINSAILVTRYIRILKRTHTKKLIRTPDEL